mmetsp:Transcript_24430/g.39909  ORF Transcript_24430/g.39909 Transcript_24430/m.39909 type:complete len:202 (+) Transcript_24430:3-608(+)
MLFCSVGIRVGQGCCRHARNSRSLHIVLLPKLSLIQRREPGLKEFFGLLRLPRPHVQCPGLQHLRGDRDALLNVLLANDCQIVAQLPRCHNVSRTEQSQSLSSSTLRLAVCSCPGALAHHKATTSGHLHQACRATSAWLSQWLGSWLFAAAARHRASAGSRRIARRKWAAKDTCRCLTYGGGRRQGRSIHATGNLSVTLSM